MAVQFAGSSSTGDRRRRRLVVNGEGTGVDTSSHDGDGAEMESQLVASEAAGPWVPASEMRIWIGALVICLLLGALSYALSRPDAFHASIVPLTDHLLVGSRPVLAVGAQTLFLALSAQLGMLISWYRARCRLDFAGRYRVWPWASALFAIAAFCMATNTHRPLGAVIHKNRVFGEMARQNSWLSDHGTIVAWLVPFCLAAFPIALRIDRDMRNSRSSLFTFRISIFLSALGVLLELFQTELRNQSWFEMTSLLIPVFASASLFVSLWLHARIVAYVCPDPPELDERSAWSVLRDAAGWLGSRILFWRRSGSSSVDEEAKPKRRRKKTDAEETATKRKRKTPVKRSTTRTRTRSKPTDDEEPEESNDTVNDEESESVTETAEDSQTPSKSSWEGDQEKWEEEPAAQARKPSAGSNSKGNGRITLVDDAHDSSAPAPHSRRSAASWIDQSKTEPEAAVESNDPSEETDEDRQFQLDSGMTSDQMKGLSKRQKRELRKQLREQERTRGR